VVYSYSYHRSQQDALFFNFSTCFGQTYCPSSGVMIHSNWYLLYKLGRLSASSNVTCMTNTSCCEYSIKTPDGH